MDAAELNTRFEFHPATAETGPVHERIRAAGKAFAETILDLTVESREQSLAITQIEDAMMWANASVARRGLPASVELA